MKVVIDTDNLNLSTKRIGAAIVSVGMLVQIPAVRDALIAFIAAHPHFATIIPTLTTLWTLLHNPEVRECLGLDVVSDPKGQS